jgi:hypothetical protein
MSSYGLAAIGHTGTLGRSHQQPDDDLVQKCVSWMNKIEVVLVNGDYKATKEFLDGKYYAAVDLVMRSRVSVAEANSLLIDSRIASHHRYEFAGIFVSALYNICMTEKVISYDFDTPQVDYLAYKFPDVFVNRGILHRIGVFSRGIIINEGNALSAGTYADGVIINSGTVTGMGHYSAPICINAGKTLGRMFGTLNFNVGEMSRFWKSDAFDFENPKKQVDPRLEPYLRELSRCPAELILEQHGDVDKIKQKIWRMYHV